MQSAAATEYQLKRIAFVSRTVPVVCQNDNGPCPLLAIVNALLLRGALTLPAGMAAVPESRLLAMLAGQILDANSVEEGSAHAANVQQTVADAIALLPKLTTGIDVNLRFHSPTEFEYTAEVGVFDLASTVLLHGWVVDPRDERTAAAFGQRSYNDVVDLLVAAVGDSARLDAANSGRASLPELLCSLRASSVRAQCASPAHARRHRSLPPARAQGRGGQRGLGNGGAGAASDRCRTRAHARDCA